MYFSNAARRTLIVSITVTALAGCGGSAQMAPGLSGQVPGITTQSVQQARAQGEAAADRDAQKSS